MCDRLHCDTAAERNTLGEYNRKREKRKEKKDKKKDKKRKTAEADVDVDMAAPEEQTVRSSQSSLPTILYLSSLLKKSRRRRKKFQYP